MTDSDDTTVGIQWMAIFASDIVKEFGLNEEIAKALSEWVLSDRFEEIWKDVSDKMPEDAGVHVFQSRVRAARQLVTRGYPPAHARYDIELLLTAYGWFDSEERQKKADELVDEQGEYPHIKKWIAGLEQDKEANPNLEDQDFARYYAQTYSRLVRSDDFHTLAGARRGFEQKWPIFLEYLERKRPDLLPVLGWRTEAIRELERIELNLPPRSEIPESKTPESKTREQADKLILLMEERNAAKVDLERRGFIPGSDDYERVINLFEARIGRVLEDEE